MGFSVVVFFVGGMRGSFQGCGWVFPKWVIWIVCFVDSKFGTRGCGGVTRFDSCVGLIAERVNIPTRQLVKEGGVKLLDELSR